MEVATANPGQLLFEALKDIKEKQDETMPDDYALFFDVPSSYPSIDSVVLLAKVAEAVLEHAQGSPNVKRGFPLTELKIRSDLRKLRTSKEDYDVIQKWLLEVDRALTEKSQQLRMHKGSVEMHRKQVMYRQPAFHYLRPFFPPLVSSSTCSRSTPTLGLL